MTKDKPSRPVWFPEWKQSLKADPSLTPGLQESYRSVIGSFLSFCKERRMGATAKLAREYVDLRRLERAPESSQLQEWKDGLNWFFKCGAKHRRQALKGVPPLGRDDLGTSDWEMRLIRRIRELRYAWRTEQTYRGWAWRFARFLQPRGMVEASGAEVRAFLSKLATETRIGAASQKQALNALVFLLKEVEGKELGDFSNFTRPRKRERIPVVLSRRECDLLFERMEGTPRLMAELMYGSGLRLMELLRLRVHPVR